MRTRFLAGTAALALCAAPASAHFGEEQIWVIDFANDKIFVVDSNTWGVTELPQAVWQLNKPGAFEFTYHGHLLIANYATNTVDEYDPDAVSFTALTAADGINGPYGARSIAIGPGHGDVFITNLTSGEILKFDEDYVSQGVFADTSDGLVRPNAIAFLADGHLLVADRGTNTVSHFDSQTGVATPWDTFVNQPIDIAIADNQDVFVLDNAGTLFRYTGGVVAAKVALGTYGGGNGAIALNSDHDTIVHTNPVDSAIRTIDPVTGVDTVQVTIPGKPIGLAIPGGQYAPGSFIEFGEPLAGTGGVEPVLHGHDEPRIGDVTDIELHDFVGGAPLIMFFSSEMEESDVLGAEFHIDLLSPVSFWLFFTADGVPGVAGDGGVDLSFPLPNDPALVGTKWFMQAVGLDAGAIQGASFSACLTMYIGA